MLGKALRYQCIRDLGIERLVVWRRWGRKTKIILSTWGNSSLIWRRSHMRKRSRCTVCKGLRRYSRRRLCRRRVLLMTIFLWLWRGRCKFIGILGRRRRRMSWRTLSRMKMRGGSHSLIKRWSWVKNYYQKNAAWTTLSSSEKNPTS